MLIEVRGKDHVLRELCLVLSDQLQCAGYAAGPRVGSMMDGGTVITYLKNASIVSLQVAEESEAGESALRVEAEQEIPELYDLWDSALIVFAKTIKEQLMDFAVNKQKVEQGIR